MNKRRQFPVWTSVLLLGVLAVSALAFFTAARAEAQGDISERWIHVRVEPRQGTNEMVRVNVPLSLAEAILPSVNSGNLRNGKVRVGHSDINGADLKVILDAIGKAKDGEFVSVQKPGTDIHIEKKNGLLLVHVMDAEKKVQNRVEVQIPFVVARAMLIGNGQELDLVAGLHALAAQGPLNLVRVEDGTNVVRVWLDDQNKAE